MTLSSDLRCDLSRPASGKSENHNQPVRQLDVLFANTEICLSRHRRWQCSQLERIDRYEHQRSTEFCSRRVATFLTQAATNVLFAARSPDVGRSIGNRCTALRNMRSKHLLMVYTSRFFSEGSGLGAVAPSMVSTSFGVSTMNPRSNHRTNLGERFAVRRCRPKPSSLC